MVNDMNAKERLQALEGKLRDRGVVDVKFFFGLGTTSLGTAVSEAADVFDAILAKRFDKMPALGDSART